MHLPPLIQIGKEIPSLSIRAIPLISLVSPCHVQNRTSHAAVTAQDPEGPQTWRSRASEIYSYCYDVSIPIKTSQIISKNILISLELQTPTERPQCTKDRQQMKYVLKKKPSKPIQTVFSMAHGDFLLRYFPPFLTALIAVDSGIGLMRLETNTPSQRFGTTLSIAILAGSRNIIFRNAGRKILLYSSKSSINVPILGTSNKLHIFNWCCLRYFLKVARAR